MADFPGAIAAKNYCCGQGKYYYTALSIDGKDQLDFNNELIIAGCRYVLIMLIKGYVDNDNGLGFGNANLWDGNAWQVILISLLM